MLVAGAHVSVDSLQGTACDATDFVVPYDRLVVAVGASSNTFGIKGVREHCVFLKQVRPCYIYGTCQSLQQTDCRSRTRPLCAQPSATASSAPTCPDSPTPR